MPSCLYGALPAPFSLFSNRALVLLGVLIMHTTCQQLTAAWSLTSCQTEYRVTKSNSLHHRVSFLSVPNRPLGSNLLHTRHRFFEKRTVSGSSLSESLGDGDNESDRENDLPEQQRVRKRDILKRTLGLGSNGGSANIQGDGTERVKFNTGGLFQGMPGIGSIIGSDSSLPKADISDYDNQKTEEEIVFRKEGEIPVVDFLTPEEESEINATYSEIKKGTEATVYHDFFEGNYSKYVTEEDVQKIVDYAIEVERSAEWKKKNEERQKEVIQKWEEEAAQKEEDYYNDITSGGFEDVLEKDAVAREMVSEWEAKEKARDEKVHMMQQLKEYEEKEFRKRWEELKAQVDFASDPNVDVDEVYEKVLNAVKKSRKEKFRAKDLGVYSTTIELEEGEEYVRKRKEEKELWKEIEREVGNEDVMKALVPPESHEENRIYYEIVTSIIKDREEARDEANERDGTDEEEDHEELNVNYAEDDDRKLSAKETIQALKMLNEWRRMRYEEEQLKYDFGIKSSTYRKEKQEVLQKILPILRKGLSCDDDVENSSNEVLIKELAQEGITKERGLRLLEKLQKTRGNNSAYDELVNDAIKDIKASLMVDKEKPAKKPSVNDYRTTYVPERATMKTSIDDYRTTPVQKQSASKSSEPSFPSGSSSVDKVDPSASLSEGEVVPDIFVDEPDEDEDVEEEEEADEYEEEDEEYLALRSKVKEEKANAEEEMKKLMKFREQMMKKLDEVGNEGIPEDFDADKYADDVISDFKPFPVIRKKKDSLEEFLYDRPRNEGTSTTELEINGGDYSPGAESTIRKDGPSKFDTPDWLRQEQIESGARFDAYDGDDDYDDYDDDTYDEDEIEFRIENGLDTIDDVDDKKYRNAMYSEFSGFEARKKNLLEYTQLTVEDINNVMAFKTDPVATGINPYLYSRERPFSAFGAIFRLEGVLVDMAGLQLKAWKKAAAAHGYKIERIEDVKQASLYNAYNAADKVFLWTNDNLEWRSLADSHKAAFNKAFKNWEDLGSNVIHAGDRDYGGGLGSVRLESSNKASSPTKEEIEGLYLSVWKKIAEKIGKEPPSADDMEMAMDVAQVWDWEKVVTDTFGWVDQIHQMKEIITAFEGILEVEETALMEKYEINDDVLDVPEVVLQDGAKVLLDNLRKVGMPYAVMSFLTSDQLDVVLEKTGLSEYFPPDKRVSVDNKYPGAREEMLGCALRIERRPDQCVVFDNTPYAERDAHEMQMKIISFVDQYPKYDLLAADLSPASPLAFELITLRSIFSERDDSQPMLEINMNSRETQKYRFRTAQSYWDEGDR